MMQDWSLTITKILLYLLLIAFIGLCVFASIQNPIANSIEMLFSNIWTWVFLSDLYIGLILVFLFMMFFEKRLIMRLVWLMSLICLGNIATLAFIIIYFDKVHYKLQK